VIASVTIRPRLSVTASANNIPACTNTTEATFTASGGDTNFVYAIVLDGATPASTDFSASNLATINAVGDYDVYVRDNAGAAPYCEAVYNFNVAKDLPLAITVTNTPVSCSGNSNAALSIAATGGGGTFQYSIDDGTTYQTSNTFLNLGAGSYNVRVIDINNCPVTEIYVIDEPFNLSASAGVTEVIECNGDKGAEVRITNALGGTLPYEYSFDGGNTYQTSHIGYLPAGTHSLFIRDAGMCTYPMSVTVADALPEPDFTSGVEYTCDGEATITITPSILTGFDYDYEINNMANTPPESNVFYDVPPGTHNVTINYVANPAPVAGDLLFDDFGTGPDRATSEIDPRYCYEPQNGLASDCPVFGTDTHIQDGEYTVTNTIVNPYAAWLSPNDHTDPTNPNGRFLAINVGGVAGTDGIIYAKRGVEVLPNRTITISLEAFNLLRNGTDGGDPSIVIQLVNPLGNVKNFGPNDWHNFTVELNPGMETNLDIVIRTSSAVLNGNDIAIDDIQAFQIPLVCAQTKEITVVVEEGRELKANITGSSSITCNGLANGTMTFEIENFDPVGGYEYAINGGSFSSPQTTSPITITGLTSGTTSVVVRDVNVNSCSVTLTQSVTEPASLVASASITAPNTCSNGGATITASATGGTPAYAFQLEDTSGTIIASYQTSPIFLNVPVGSYNIRINDVNNCDDLIDAPIQVVAPTEPTFTTDQTDCYTGNNDGTIQVDVTSIPGNGGFQFNINGAGWITPTPDTATSYTFTDLAPGLTTTGGSGSYTYEWSNDGGATYSSSNFSGNTFTTSTAGNYVFRATDTTGPSACEFITAPLVVTPADKPVITTVTPTDILCNGLVTGSLDVTIDTTIGTPPYDIEVIETGTATNYGTQVNSLPAGNYEVRITDGKGCVSDPYAVTIAQPDVIQYDIVLNSITCDPTSGTVPGSISIENLQGGTAEYQYFLTGNNGYSGTYTTLMLLMQMVVQNKR